ALEFLHEAMKEKWSSNQYTQRPNALV
ncbi:MAG: hypothetical protein RL614_90, partial [Pseudomonadota bacterium]